MESHSDFARVLSTINAIEVISDTSHHSVVFKVTLGSGETCALKVVFIYDGEEENKELRPSLPGEERKKTTTSPKEFYDECATQQQIVEKSSPHKISPDIYFWTILSTDEATSFIVKLDENSSLNRHANYLREWVQNGYKLGVIEMELLGSEFKPLSEIVRAGQDKDDERLKPYLPRIFAIILFMASELKKTMLDPNLGNFMAISGNYKSVRVIDLAETVELPDYLNTMTVSSLNVDACLRSIGNAAFEYLKDDHGYPFTYSPYAPNIEIAFENNEKYPVMRNVRDQEIVSMKNETTSAFNNLVGLDQIDSRIGVTSMSETPELNIDNEPNNGIVGEGTRINIANMRIQPQELYGGAHTKRKRRRKTRRTKRRRKSRTKRRTKRTNRRRR